MPEKQCREKPREVLKDDGLLAAFLICFVVFVSCREKFIPGVEAADIYIYINPYIHLGGIMKWHHNLGLCTKQGVVIFLFMLMLHGQFFG